MLMSTRSLRSCPGTGQCSGNALSKLLCRSLSAASVPDFRRGMKKEIGALPEIKARNDLLSFLRTSASASNGLAYGTDLLSSSPFHHVPPEPPAGGYRHVMSPDQIRTTLDAAMATFHLHVESRVAALCGQGFYTIGPCGEEMLSSIGHALDPDVDAVALHYRHLGVSIVRQLRQGRAIENILLDRARGYLVSTNDPVTGGVHCAIGSRVSLQDLRTGSGDYVVTSTLASQCPPAVGRALGFSVASKLLQRSDKPSTRPVSFVSIGDGSMHNAHFLSSFNLARHARYRRIKCPVVFGISDNGLSISYQTNGYTRSLFNLRGDEIPMWSANGTDMLDVYDKTIQATEYSRKKAAPSLLLYKDITRRFGHAATDRQHAYLSEGEVLNMAESDVISAAVVQAVEQQNIGTFSEWLDRFEEIGSAASNAFDAASIEPKITRREDMLSIVSQPMVPVPRLPEAKVIENADRAQKTGTSNKKRDGKAEVMRKHMTRVIAETLEKHSDCLYIGEDVEHGGYYLVTDGLVKKFPNRIIDFPPDETTLLGAAMGYSQVGLTPIVEIPYCKYLDCGVDTFYELAISNWLTNGQRPNGMIVRIQGFDRGVFGGNFHTHNSLSHIPPGVDAVCYSNGRDYARGFRNAIKQAQAGRVVMFIDCTNLLNLRHLHQKDRGWETTYPPDEEGEIMAFDDVKTYAGSGDGSTRGKYAIVTYGNGVVTALQSRKEMIDRKDLVPADLDVIDCPYLSSVPSGLKEIIGNYDGALFADICKEGPGSNILSPMISQLKKDDALPNNWDFVAAPRTYNPLGNTITFLSQEDIMGAFRRIVARDVSNKSGNVNDELKK